MSQAMRDLLEDSCWDYVIHKRELEDAWGAMHMAEIEFERLMAEFRAALLADRRAAGE